MNLSRGDTIDRYDLVELLGEGGQGSVWRVIDRIEVSAPRAIKLVDLAACTPEQAERVRREARRLAQLDHPSLVPVHGLFEDVHRQILGLVMTYVEGTTLDVAWRDERMTDVKKQSILVHLAHVLAYVHRQGIVHRDLKLENVLVTTEFWSCLTDPTTVKLIDFGIAAQSGESRPLTEVGHVVGTPSYIAPERMDPGMWGPPRSAASADVFAFGVVAWRLLVGGHPTGLPDTAGLGSFANAYRKAAAVPDGWLENAPSTTWAPLLRACLAIHPGDRPADARQLLPLIRGVVLRGEMPAMDNPSAQDERRSVITTVDDGPERTEEAAPPAEALMPPSQGPAPPVIPKPPAPRKRRPWGIIIMAAGLVAMLVAGAGLGASVLAFFGYDMLTEQTKAKPKKTAPRSTRPRPTATYRSPPKATVTATLPSPAGTVTWASGGVCGECASGKLCGGACSQNIGLSERIALRPWEVRVKEPNGKTVGLFEKNKNVEVCMRRSGSSSWVCTPLPDPNGGVSSKSLEVTGWDLQNGGIYIAIRELGGSRQYLVMPTGRRYREGVTRRAICKGLGYMNLRGRGGVYQVYFHLDPPGVAPPRCKK